MSKVYGDFLEGFEDTQRRAAFATVSKHSLSQMPPPNMPQQKMEAQQQNQQQPQHVQQGQQQPSIQQQAAPQQQVPAQINMQNQQNQQQQYLQNIQYLQAQAQATLQGPGTPGQQQQQLPVQQQQMRAQPPQQVQPPRADPPPPYQQQQQGDKSRTISPPSQQPVTAQNIHTRLPNLPAPAEVTQARADIEEWKASLLSTKRELTFTS